MRRSLSTTTAIVTSLALVLPVTLPYGARQAMAQQGGDAVCTEDMNERQCDRAQRRAERQEAREQRQEARGDAREQGQQGGQGQGQQQGQQQGQNGFGRDQAAPDQAPQQIPEQTPQQEAPQQQQPQQPAEQPAEEPQGNAQGNGFGNAQNENQNNAPVNSVEDLEGRLGGEAPAEEQPQPEVQPEPTPEPAPEATAPEATQPRAAEETEPRRPRVTDERPAASDGSQDAVATPPNAPADVDTMENALRGEGTPRTEGGFAGDELPEDGASAAADEAATGDAVVSDAVTGEGEVVDEVTEQVTEENTRRSSEGFRDGERRPRDRDTRDGDRAEGRDRDRRNNDDDDRIPDFLTGAVVGAAGALIVGSLLDGNREVVSTAPDRVVVRDQYGNLQVLRDDDAILRQPGSEVTTRRYNDGSTETIVMQRDGSQTVTVRSAEGRVIKRVVIAPDGRRTVLFDDTVQYEPVVVSELPEINRNAAPQVQSTDEDALRAALYSESQVNRSFSLNQVRQIDRVRYLAPAVQVENITFETGSAAISPTEAQELLELGELMTQAIADNPNEVFLIEGHTDAVGSAVSNLTLSDRRAESVALALTEYFGVSPANMVLQGYGESDLRVATDTAERENRRVVVRRITPLLQVAQAN